MDVIWRHWQSTFHLLLGRRIFFCLNSNFLRILIWDKVLKKQQFWVSWSSFSRLVVRGKKLHWQLLAAKGLMRIVLHIFTNVHESISNRKRRASARTPKFNRSAENVQTATRRVCIHGRRLHRLTCLHRCAQSSGAVWKWRWPSWAPVPNKPTVSVDVKQHSANRCAPQLQEKIICQSCNSSVLIFCSESFRHRKNKRIQYVLIARSRTSTQMTCKLLAWYVQSRNLSPV